MKTLQVYAFPRLNEDHDLNNKMEDPSYHLLLIDKFKQGARYIHTYKGFDIFNVGQQLLCVDGNIVIYYCSYYVSHDILIGQRVVCQSGVWRNPKYKQLRGIASEILLKYLLSITGAIATDSINSQSAQIMWRNLLEKASNKYWTGISINSSLYANTLRVYTFDNSDNSDFYRCEDTAIDVDFNSNPVLPWSKESQASDIRFFITKNKPKSLDYAEFDKIESELKSKYYLE